MIKTAYTIKTDKGWSATLFIHAMKEWHVPEHIQTATVASELRTFFARLFDTPLVRIIAEDCYEKSTEEHHRALLERDKALLTNYEGKVEALKQKIEIAKRKGEKNA